MNTNRNQDAEPMQCWNCTYTNFGADFKFDESTKEYVCPQCKEREFIYTTGNRQVNKPKERKG